jgi:hypothetical protein
MATYKHTSGAVTASKRVVVKDACVQATETVIEVDQPAGTILNNVFVRFIGGVTLGGADDLGWELGVSTSGNTLGTNANGFLDNGTVVTANAVFDLASVSADDGTFLSKTVDDFTSAPAAIGYTDTQRTLFFTIITPNQTVTGDNKVELNFIFTHLI